MDGYHKWDNQEVFSDFIQKMCDSGYYQATILEVIKSAVKKFYCQVIEQESGGKRLYRLSEEMEKCCSKIIISCVNEPSSYQLETRVATIHLSILPNSDNYLPLDTCYLINTSGTSGKSKLVYVTNNSVVHNVIDMKKQFLPGSEDLFFLASPLTFDPHILDIFVSLSAGARLLLLPRTLMTRGDLGRELFNNHKVTIMQCTPSMLERMGEEENEK